jgi:hypothetical protein
MRKLMFSTGAIVIACAAFFTWSQTMATPTQAGAGLSVNPTEMMLIYKGPLPIEQWDAI